MGVYGIFLYISMLGKFHSKYLQIQQATYIDTYSFLYDNYTAVVKMYRVKTGIQSFKK